MKIINGFITSAESLEIAIQPGDTLANSANPGSWETRAVAAGGKGIVWSSQNAVLEIPVQYVGNVCKVTPLTRPSVVSVKVETEISTDKGKSYKSHSGETEIQFVEEGKLTQLAVVSNDPSAIGYKKLLPMLILLCALCGCAHFQTTQTDTRYNEETHEKTTITTKASASTFFDSKSALVNFKAAQTEKSQGASVGSLTQESSGSNAVNLAEAIAKGATKGAMEALK